MKEDTGQILIVDKIVNNNIVIAKDFRGREVVAIGLSLIHISEPTRPY